MFTSLASQYIFLSAQVHKHPYLVITLLLLALPLLLTYALSTYLFHRAISTAKTNAAANNGLASPTPALPYWIPFLGHTISLVFETSRFMRRLASTYGNMPVKLYFMADTGLSREDQLRGEIDELSGVLPQPNPGWEHLPDHKRWNLREHAVYGAHLSSSAQESILGARLAEGFTRDLLSWAAEHGEGWIDVPDLTKFLRENLFIAATSALYEDELLGSIAPDLPKDYWDWLDQMPRLFRRLPRWMIPGAYAARERTLDSLMKWDEAKRRGGAPSKGQLEWDPLHGSTLTQARTVMFDEFGIGREGSALFHSAMLFALTPNATYATIWALLHILREGPNLISRVLAESAPYFQEPNSLSIRDTTELSRLPLLSSIFMETLRLRAASPVGRTPIDDTFYLSSPSPPLNIKWKLDKDVHIISSSWLGGHDASFWNEGPILAASDKPAHPVDTFWAERFLEYPDDPFSGPVKKKNVVHTASLANMKEKTSSGDKKAKLVTQGTSSHWFPLAGG
ncbi:cytochrome P450 [Rhypophila decipiens]|uniref:Cytochrome P450 n=1 Tax=Rhypophila decipiens TaxID=261697 RepID=A0AAN6Y343_9PEZI|nr:cytochrome P450 [Rhypophila decipiens]